MKTKGRPRPKGKKNRAQSTAVCVGLICPGFVWNSGLYEGGAYHRIIVETTEVLRREYEAKLSGCRDGKPNIGSKTRNANIIPGTEGGGVTAKLPWKLLKLWPADY